MLRKFCRIEMRQHRSDMSLTAAHKESGFRKTIARKKCLSAEAATSEDRDETIQHIRPHRLRTAESGCPGTEVELFNIFSGCSAGAKIVSEAGPTAESGSRGRNGF